MIYQIYYRPEQKEQVVFTPYYNEKCSVYFENKVIAEVTSKEKNDDAFFGVLPYNYIEKIERMRIMRRPFRNIGSPIYKDGILFFMQHAPHDPIKEAAKVHPKFDVYWNEIIKAVGYKWSHGIWENVIYCNFFLAKHGIYKIYVDELLIPAMKVMDCMPELNHDAKYPKKISKELIEQTGFPYYTYHTFLCERMFSYWYNFLRAKYER